MPKTIIFANGESTAIQENKQYIDKDDIIICADGGAIHALNMNIVPHHLVGDFDSLDQNIVESLRIKGVNIEQHPQDKDKTDLELALEAAAIYPPQELLVLTAFGGRLDQLLGNIILLAGGNWPFQRIGMADGNQRAWIMRGRDALNIQGQPGDLLSIIPLDGDITGLNISGVKWPLQNKFVKWGSTLTLSNEFLDEQVETSLLEGSVLVINIKKGPVD